MLTATPAQPYITAYEDATHYQLGGDQARILAEGNKTNGSLSLVHLTVKYGESAPLHVHHTQDESFFVLHGTLKGICGETEWTATGGSFIWLPRGVKHTYQGVSEIPAEVLVITVPGGFDAFVVEAGSLLDEGRETGAMDVDPARLAAIAAGHGIEILGPPINFL